MFGTTLFFRDHGALKCRVRKDLGFFLCTVEPLVLEAKEVDDATDDCTERKPCAMRDRGGRDELGGRVNTADRNVFDDEPYGQEQHARHGDNAESTWRPFHQGPYQVGAKERRQEPTRAEPRITGCVEVVGACTCDACHTDSHNGDAAKEQVSPAIFECDTEDHQQDQRSHKGDLGFVRGEVSPPIGIQNTCITNTVFPNREPLDFGESGIKNFVELALTASGNFFGHRHEAPLGPLAQELLV